MAPKINFTMGSLPKRRIRDTSPRAESVDTEFVRASLGATVAGSSKGLDLFEVHETLGRLLRSSGGRPTLEGTTAQVKIPKIESDWEKLADLVAHSPKREHKPSAGQMAAVLIHLALSRFSTQEIEAARQELERQPAEAHRA